MAQKVDDTGMVRVLVYGTLKDGQTNARLMDKIGAKFLGYDSITDDGLHMEDVGPFPAVFHRDNDPVQKVCGEVYGLNEEGLAHLDFYEGQPHFFRRRKFWSDIMKKRVWMYIMQMEEIRTDEDHRELWRPSTEEQRFWNAA